MSVSTDMSGRVAIITGGNSGIGLATAKLYAQAGAAVIIASRREQENAAAVDKIHQMGGKAIAFTYDAMREKDADDLVQKTLDVHGRLDVCFANAGGVPGKLAPLVDLDAKSWHDTITLNLDAPFFLFRAAARPMIAANRGGALIATSSVAAIQSTPTIHYAAAKGGLNSLVMSLAGQLGRYNIRVNSIMPGIIETPPQLQRLAGADKLKEAILRRIPLRRFAQPEEAAQMALYLGSNHSRFVTGQAFVIDGGMTNT